MSEERHPQTILVAEQFSTANALAEWLTEKGFPAEVVRPSAAANYSGRCCNSFKPKNYFEVRQALIVAGRPDLFGGCDGPYPGNPAAQGASAKGE